MLLKSGVKWDCLMQRTTLIVSVCIVFKHFAPISNLWILPPWCIAGNCSFLPKWYYILRCIYIYYPISNARYSIRNIELIELHLFLYVLTLLQTGALNYTQAIMFSAITVTFSDAEQRTNVCERISYVHITWLLEVSKPYNYGYDYGVNNPMWRHRYSYS